MTNFKPHPEPDMAKQFTVKIPKDFSKGGIPKAEDIPEFQPRANNLRDMKDLKQVNKDFGIEPKKAQMCRKHRDHPVEFFDEIQNQFYCRRCAPDHQKSESKCVADVANEV